MYFSYFRVGYNTQECTYEKLKKIFSTLRRAKFER